MDRSNGGMVDTRRAPTFGKKNLNRAVILSGYNMPDAKNL